MDDFNPNEPSHTRPDSENQALDYALLEDTLDGLIEERKSDREPRHDGDLAGGPAHRDGECPRPDVWLRFAVGQMPPGEADARLSHAAFCRPCAERLRLALRVNDEQLSEEESPELAGLDANSAEGRRRLAARLAVTPRQGAKRSRLPLWVGTGVAASLLIAAPLAVWWQRANSPERLLAESYSHARIFDLRMPGAGFSAVSPATHLRGGSPDREPAKLLDARTRIERHLESAPHDAHWLELQARSDLLEENFDPAIDIFDRLLAAGPLTASLLADDAAAYFERGRATGSENDRATALDYLRRADELSPGDPVVLFNEAVVMEDRGQAMNAVETWNRYLRFERDPQWLAEGRSRLAALEEKLNRMKTHQSRMEQHLATPQSMRALAANAGELAAVDEELSSTMLPRLLHIAFPAPADRARGSPCADNCQAARDLLHALAGSLQQNHQDPWLTRFLPSDSSPPNVIFNQAAESLGRAIDANVREDHAAAERSALQASRLFHRLDNAAGEDRADIERIYSLQRAFRLADCRALSRGLLGRDSQFVWIHISAIAEEWICDTGPGSATENAPAIAEDRRLAQDHRYRLLEFRADNLAASMALESGDAEDAWRIDLGTLRNFYAGDYPPLRIASTVGGLANMEQSTPRKQLALLAQQEYVGILGLTPSRGLVPEMRMTLAAIAIRAGQMAEAGDQMRLAESEMASQAGAGPNRHALFQNEVAMADFYLGRGALKNAADLLDAAHADLAGDESDVHIRNYAAARGQLELALGRPEAAESVLRDAILDAEREGANAGTGNVIYAMENRDLYAVLAGVWLAEGRSGEDILALWERYRLRILGEPAPVCADRRLGCLKPNLTAALERLGSERTLVGQIVLQDRLLLYRAGVRGVEWSTIPIGKDELLDAANPLERAAGSSTTSLDSVDQAARRVGNILIPKLPGPDSPAPKLPGSPGSNDSPSTAVGELLIEPDPLLGNLPWAAVETASGPIGLRFNLEEVPSLLLSQRQQRTAGEASHAGSSMVVGASVAWGDDEPLPEVPREARDVAQYLRNPDVLLAGAATETNVAAALANAPAIHFAGHAVQHAGATRLLLAAGPAGAAPFLDSSLLRKHPPRAARLAVFSACSTGKREEGWNHGMGDIVNTLAALGVPEVVATHWQVDSASAVPIMDAFYAGLARGFTVPQALTLARQSLIRDPRYRHPYYWAAYYASGTGTTDLREVFHGNSK
jgi:tetratricopeptide (TPR) repeat protein